MNLYVAHPKDGPLASYREENHGMLANYDRTKHSLGKIPPGRILPLKSHNFRYFSVYSGKWRLNKGPKTYFTNSSLVICENRVGLHSSISVLFWFVDVRLRLLSKIFIRFFCFFSTNTITNFSTTLCDKKKTCSQLIYFWELQTFTYFPVFILGIISTLCNNLLS